MQHFFGTIDEIWTSFESSRELSFTWRKDYKCTHNQIKVTRLAIFLNQKDFGQKKTSASASEHGTVWNNGQNTCRVRRRNKKRARESRPMIIKCSSHFLQNIYTYDEGTRYKLRRNKKQPTTGASERGDIKAKKMCIENFCFEIRFFYVSLSSVETLLFENIWKSKSGFLSFYFESSSSFHREWKKKSRVIWLSCAEISDCTFSDIVVAVVSDVVVVVCACCKNLNYTFFVNVSSRQQAAVKRSSKQHAKGESFLSLHLSSKP